MPRLMQHTSLEAFDSVQAVIPKNRDRVMALIHLMGDFGISSHEIVEHAGILLQTVSGTLRGLAVDGLIEHNGEYATSPSGRRAMRWVATEKAKS